MRSLPELLMLRKRPTRTIHVQWCYALPENLTEVVRQNVTRCIKVLCQSGKRINMVFYPITRQMPERKKLNECPAADAGTVSKIISSFGRLKNFLILFDLILM
ncbi:hypothetical protein P4909_24900 [Escherichia coli]